jgi:pseudouridine-5'-phosphate glycosidase
MEMEQTVREHGAVPATIAILAGKPKIGLSSDEVKHLAQAGNVEKAGTRDIARVIASGMDGATTVSATSRLASMAGIKVFATGGIGGVHRGAERSRDISSDLWELANTSIIVVSAGAKAILDLPATLEWLETYQVPVYGFRTEEFPAFYSRKSGLRVPALDGAEEAARVFDLHSRISESGMLVAVPVPEEYEIDINDEIKQAVEEASSAGKTGAEVTPWILARVKELTGGESVKTNIALLRNNAAVGAEIAAALSSMRCK